MKITSEQWHKGICDFIDEQDEEEKADVMRNYLLSSLVYKEIISNNIISQCMDKKLLKNLKAHTDKPPIIPARVKEKDRDKHKEKTLAFLNLYNALKKHKHMKCVDKKMDAVKAIKCFYELWIEQALHQINYITHATHVAKITHSGNGGSSIIDDIPDTNDAYLTTSSLNSIIYDGAYPDAIFSKIAKFLLIQIGGVTLGNVLKKGDITPLQHFVSKEKLTTWQTAFKERLNPSLKAHSLSKQVYYPVNSEHDHYHLLVVLNSSSLIQSVYNSCFHKDVRKATDKIFKLKNSEKYSDQILEQITDSIALATVMSQPQNVSVNSGSRGGNIRLFSGASPIWESTLKPPLYDASMFYHKKLNHFAIDNIKGLQKMLITFDNANISFKEPKRLQGVINWANAIANNVIDYSQVISVLPNGWTQDNDCKLCIEHQIFLDCYRNDEEFLQQKIQLDWQSKITTDFVLWLNNKLKNKKEHFSATEEHSRIWRDVFSDILRDHVELLNSNKDIKNAHSEVSA